MRLLVAGGAGFIGSNFVRIRVRDHGDEVVVLDKLTYSGNPANLEGADVEFVRGDVCDREAVAAAAARCEAVVIFAAETHVEAVEVLAAPRIRELVQHDELIALSQALADEVGADEAGPTANQNFHLAPPSGRRF